MSSSLLTLQIENEDFARHSLKYERPKLRLSNLLGVFGVLTSIFASLHGFFSADSEVAEKPGHRKYLDLFIILILIGVGWALVYVIVFPPSTPPYP